MREQFGQTCCRETIRAALHRLQLSWKKAKKLLGRADPARRQVFIEQRSPAFTKPTGAVTISSPLCAFS